MKNRRPKPRGTERSAGTVRLVTAALILRVSESGEQQLLVCQRTATQAMALKWEFPGGKLEPGETAPQALKRELEEELGIDAEIGRAVTRIRHNYRNGGAVDIQFFLVEQFAGELQNKIFNEIRWSAPAQLPDLDFLAADVGLIRDLAEGRITIP